ncbi:hypothetical protein [Novosphingobium colocasiae]|uniref:hypothetical protein n=1 Tax=Novosphingobium colocasiae TaxID=1256513 RepID=UPI0035B1DD0F
MPDALLSSPEWFPERIDWRNGLIRLLRVSRETLRDSAFLDGRTPLAAGGEAQVIDLHRFVAAVPPAAHSVGWIFHEGFCGSTLLGRFLTVDDHALCLREPQVLVDLADWSAGLPAGDEPAFAAALHAVVAKLAQPWHDGERIAIKPSNWANPIAARLLAAVPGSAAVLAVIDAEPFIVAVLRGGRERIGFVLDLQRHLLLARPELGALFADVLAHPPDDPAALLRHLAATHAIQRRVLDELTVPERLDFPHWLATAHETARHTAAALGLAIPAAALACQVDRASRTHSKTAHESYEPGRDADANATILRLHGAAIAEAIAEVSGC